MEELEKLQPGIIDGVGTVMITEKESNGDSEKKR